MAVLPSSMVLTLFFLLLCFITSTLNGALFSTLPRTLVVFASPKSGQGMDQVLRAGEDSIILSWDLNQSLPSGTESSYKKVKSMLCYAPVSQVDRPWRRAVDDLAKDNTCPFTIAIEPYTCVRNTMINSEYSLGLDLPTATYFVRAYVLDAGGSEVAYGQTDDLFEIVGVSGRYPALDAAAWCFSALSVVALLVFLAVEKRKVRLYARTR